MSARRASRLGSLVLALVAGCSAQSDSAPRSPAVPPMVAEVAPPAEPAAPPDRDVLVDDGRGPAPGTPLILPDGTPAPLLTVPAGALDRFYASLDRAERKDPGGHVVISMFGDSHTAGDQITRVLRRQLGARFGQGGRGLVLAGRPPVRHYYVREVGYASSGKWAAELVGARDAAPPFGLAGVRAHAERKTALAWVESCAGCPTEKVDRFEVFYLRTRSSGKLTFRVDSDRWQTIPTRLARTAPTERQASVVSVPTRSGRHRLSLRPAGGGPVHLFAVALDRNGPGVTVDGLGVTGRRLFHLRTADWDDVVGPQLAARAPALVVLQYGTNEADDAKLDLAVLARHYDEVIALVRTWAPDADVLLVGPPDLNKRAAGKACDRRKKGVPPPPPLDCEWHTPPNLPAVVEVQRAAAARNHVAFFDTLAAFGGVEQMDAMLHLDPPLAFTDHVHLTQPGYERWARTILDELMAGYGAWKQGASGAARAPSTTLTHPSPSTN